VVTISNKLITKPLAIYKIWPNRIYLTM